MNRALRTLPDAHLLVCVAIIAAAVVALAAGSRSESLLAIAVAVFVIAFLPLFVLAPAHWFGRISAPRYLHEGQWLMPGGFANVFVAVAARELTTIPVPAAILMASAAYLAVAGRRPWRRVRRPAPWVWITASGCAIYGAAFDWPVILGWQAFASAAFGASAFLALAAAIEPSASEAGAAQDDAAS